MENKFTFSFQTVLTFLLFLVLNVYVCLFLFSQQEDDHCFIIQDIEDQCREGLIMQNDDHLFLQSRYLFSARGSMEKLKLDCKPENKYIQSTCFAREVIC